MTLANPSREKRYLVLGGSGGTKFVESFGLRSQTSSLRCSWRQAVFPGQGHFLSTKQLFRSHQIADAGTWVGNIYDSPFRSARFS
jgi:hypothetical protein